MSHWTGTRVAPEPYRGVLDRREAQRIRFRELFVHTTTGADHLDRRERRAELAALGGLDYVRRIRRRIARVRRAKAAVAPRELTQDELDRVLPPVACRRSRDSRPTDTREH